MISLMSSSRIFTVTLKNNLKDIARLIEPIRSSKVSELDPKDWKLFTKHAFLYKHRLQIADRFMHMSDEVNLQEVL